MPIIVEKVKGRCTSCGDGGGAKGVATLEVLQMSFGYLIGGLSHLQTIRVCSTCQLFLKKAMYEQPALGAGPKKFGPEPFACLEDHDEEGS